MTDSDNKNGKPENADDMSLADLLGGADTSSEDTAPRRAESRDDEPDSGMVNLARMVANSSVDIAKIPSLVPPPPSPGQPVLRDPSGSFATVASTGPHMSVPPASVPPKKGNGALIAVVAVALIAVAGIAFFALGREAPKDDSAAIEAANKAAKMMEEMQAKAEADRKAAEEKEAQLLARLEELTKKASATTDGTVSAEDQAKMDAVKAELEKATAEKHEAQEKAGDKEPARKTSAAAKTSKDPEPAAAKKEEPAAPKPATPEKNEDPADRPAAKGGIDEIDSLLAGGKPKAEDKKPAAAPGDDLPKQPSREQVTAAMAPIKAKAQASCAKYSTGTVQVQVVVSSEGKVKSASATGVFANNPAGTCVAMMARSAKFPKFKDSTFSFSYPITLQ